MAISAVIEGSIVAFGCIVVTVAAIWGTIMAQAASWYVPVSYLMLGFSMCAMAGTSVFGGWLAATSFAITYAFLSFVPPRVGFHVGVDALSALFVGSMIIGIELVAIVVLRLIHLANIGIA